MVGENEEIAVAPTRAAWETRQRRCQWQKRLSACRLNEVYQLPPFHDCSKLQMKIYTGEMGGTYNINIYIHRRMSAELQLVNSDFSRDPPRCQPLTGAIAGHLLLNLTDRPPVSEKVKTIMSSNPTTILLDSLLFICSLTSTYIRGLPSELAF